MNGTRTCAHLGIRNGLDSWNTFLFGTGIRPYDNAISETILGVDDKRRLSGVFGQGRRLRVRLVDRYRRDRPGLGLLLYLSVLLYLLRRLLPILLREKVSDHAHAFAFLGVFGIVIWLGLGWTNGGFPSTEIMFGFLALLALEDQNKERRPLLDVEPTVPLARPVRSKVVAPAR